MDKALGHRSSVDFDFWTEVSLDRRWLAEKIAFVQHSTIIQDEFDTVSLLIPSQDETVKLSFFGGIHLGRVGAPERTEDGTLMVASLEDLMATKLKVILQRAEVKGYRDVAAMIRNGVALDYGLAAARLLFGPNFQPAESLKALTYFQDGELDQLSETDAQTLAEAAGSVGDLPHICLRAKSIRDSES